jgi:hypothetical protein
VFTANGSILRYQKDNGNFFDTLVSDSALHAVYAPRGLIRGPGRTLYVANFTSDDTGPFKPGDIRQFDAANGDFIGNFNLDNTITSFPASSFFPRGLVQGPDGLIYVSVTGDLFSGDRITGKILRFDPKTGNFVDVFASNLDSSTSCARHLHRPEGLVFGPDKRLYVTSFRADPTDTDKILIFNKNGQCQDQIDLYSVQNHDPRAFAEAIMFGPKGRLFVPINNSGEVRRYNLKTRTFDRLIPPGGPLQVPWYLTFGETNPRTLGYDE